MTMPPPLPSHDDMAMARTSPAERLRVDLMYAAACGMDEGETIAFCERVALFDVRTLRIEAEDELARARAARAERDALEQEEMRREMAAPRIAVPGGGWA